MTVKLYTTDCPMCKVLKKILERKGISFEEERDLEKIVKAGFQTVPILEVNGEMMGSQIAIEWANKQ